MSVSPEELDLAKGASDTLTVSNTAGEVTAESDNEDITAVVSGDTITVSVDADTNEGGNITVSDGVTEIVVPVSIHAIMTVSPASLEIAAGASDTLTVSDAEGTVTVTSDNEDVTAEVADNTITVSVAEAATDGATLTITDGATTVTVEVTLGA